VSTSSATSPARPAPRRAAEPRLPARPGLKVVARRPRRRAGAAASVALVAVLGVLLGLAAFQTRLAQDQLELDRLEQGVREERLRFERLRGEEAVLLAPERIVAEGERLGLVTPPAVVYLPPDPAVVAAVAARAGGATAGKSSGVDPAGSTWSGVKAFAEARP
jgi:hypothetical protein